MEVTLCCKRCKRSADAEISDDNIESIECRACGIKLVGIVAQKEYENALQNAANDLTSQTLGNTIRDIGKIDIAGIKIDAKLNVPKNKPTKFFFK